MFKYILIDNLKYSVKCERLMSKKDKLELLISNIEKWCVSIEFMVLSERKIGVAQPLVIYECTGSLYISLAFIFFMFHYMDALCRLLYQKLRGDSAMVFPDILNYIMHPLIYKYIQ